MPKVLVVDDVPDNVKLLAFELADHGYEVLTAFDGLRALEVAGSARPDVILLDIMMPGIDGIEVCRRLKADAELHSIPVILVSALERQDDVVRGLDAGAHDYITKPFNDQIVLARVRSAAREKASYDLIARMNEQLERHLRRIAALRRIDRAIAASLDLRVTLETLLDQVTALLGVHAAAVLRLDPHTQVLSHAAGCGFRTAGSSRAQLGLGEGLAGRAALERRLVHAADLPSAGAGHPTRPLEGEGFVAHYAAPLVTKGQVKGVLEVFHRTDLEPDEEWLDLLEALAGQAAIAVENAGLFEDLQRANVELTLAYDATIEGWARALDLRDRETEGHSRRVTEMTLRLARAMGMGEAELVHVRRGALLHDVGKLGIPDSVLLKPGPLTEAEREVMQQHATYAHTWLEPIAFLRPALEIPHCHHEKWDGSGYPRGLKGERIPLAARIFAVADIWDALRFDRPYRKGWPEPKVREHIASLAGNHLDPDVVEVFLRTVAVPPAHEGVGPRHSVPVTGLDATMWGAFEAIFDYVLLLDEAHRVLSASPSFAAVITQGCDPRGSDFVGLLDVASQDRVRALSASPPDQWHALELGHRTSSGATCRVSYAFCKLSTPDGPRVVALGRGHQESPRLAAQIARLERELAQARRDLTEQALSEPRPGWAVGAGCSNGWTPSG
jgi:response regulator RpfG family c-di-GMP phosphodiesterase